MTTRQPSQLLFKRDRQVLDYLLSIADSEGKLTGSTYAIAHDLGMHRQILSRILRRLAKTGAVTLDDYACRPIRVTGVVTPVVTGVVTNSMSQQATDDTADTISGITSWSTTYTVPITPIYASENAESDILVTSVVTPDVTTIVTSDVTTIVTPDVTTIVTPDVTDKKETKQKNEEIPPAPPQEEKKQKKEKNSPFNACARKEISTKIDKKPIELRRQQFIDSLQPYAERYGQEMIEQFAEYWTESNRPNTRMRFELQRVWETSRRLARWAKNDYTYHSPSNSNHSGDYTHRQRTSADYVREAQEHAILETEKFIREAERRRGGVPPHIPLFSTDQNDSMDLLIP